MWRDWRRSRAALSGAALFRWEIQRLVDYQWNELVRSLRSAVKSLPCLSIQQAEIAVDQRASNVARSGDTD
jgi:hypothetical protein